MPSRTFFGNQIELRGLQKQFLKTGSRTHVFLRLRNFLRRKTWLSKSCYFSIMLEVMILQKPTAGLTAEEIHEILMDSHNSNNDLSKKCN